jgi:hypothetical protein
MLANVGSREGKVMGSGLVSGYAAEKNYLSMVFAVLDQNQYFFWGGVKILMSGITGVEWDELVHMEPEARYVSFKYGNYSGSE